MNRITNNISLACIISCLLVCSCTLEPELNSGAIHPKETDLHFQIEKENGDKSFEEEDYLSAVKFYSNALEKIEFRQACEDYAEILIQLGNAHFKLQNYKDALGFYKSYLDLPNVDSSPVNKAAGIGRIATVYQKIGNYQESFDLQHQALEIREAQKDSAGIARSFYELGSIMFYKKNYEQALEYYSKSMELLKALEKKDGILSCLIALGVTHEGMGSNNLTLRYLNRALVLAREMGKKEKESYTLHNIGVHYLRKKELDEAEAYLLKSFETKLELGDKWGQVGSHIYLADLFLTTGRIAEAQNELEQGMMLSEEIGSDVRKAEVLERFGKLYGMMGDYKKANLMLKQYIVLNDSLQNLELAKEMGNRKAQYEVQKKDKEFAVEKVKSEREKLKSIFFWVIGFLTIGMMGLYYRNSVREKFNVELRKMNDEIHLQNKELARKNEDLKKFAFIVSHDLKAPLRTIGSFTGLLRRRYFHLFDKNGEEYMAFITGGVKRMDQLLNDLLTYSQIENNEQNADWTESKDIVNNALSNLYFQIKNQNVSIDINESALPRVKGNPAHLIQLFQNIIANGIKFRNGRDPQISIDCVSFKDRKYIFSIKDNGIGIEAQYKEKIFRMFSRLHKVEEYEGTGIGLATCKKIVEKHGGNIWVESKLGEGSTFFFSLPRN